MTNAIPNRFPFSSAEKDRAEAEDPIRRVRVRIMGVVQGVGFRPFVYRTAVSLGLGGSVSNTAGGVVVEAEGPKSKLKRLVEEISSSPPPLSRIAKVEVEDMAPLGEARFLIDESKKTQETAALVPADVATCDDCLREMRDPGDRRFSYPFINCTDCGPRFTIVEAIPYDRERTMMRDFGLCAECGREYATPSDRRYHAEPNACPECGPQVELLSSTGESLGRKHDAVAHAIDMLSRGAIIAVKGLGGFHLACDAADNEAVLRLRLRKGRPHKPLAVMARDLDIVRGYCEVSEAEAGLLEHKSRPILIVRLRACPEKRLRPLAEQLAPGLKEIGVMLPCAPLQHLLLASHPISCMVMTSGNRAGGPIVIDNDEALSQLGTIADAFLVNDRPIWNRCDDSVGFAGEGGRLTLTRRSRGFVPLPVALDREVRPTLAVGAVTSNTFVFAAGDQAFLSQHVGDTDNAAILDAMREAIAHFQKWLGLKPVLIAHDLHPDISTTHLAAELSVGCRRIAIQHHHAHFASALAASGIDRQAQGLALDGTGLGSDGAIWGGELLVGTAGKVRRAGHLRLLPLPGGDAAVRRPLRTAASYLHALVPWSAAEPLPLWERADKEELAVVRRMVDRNFNVRPTSSAGRLFDAVAALLGVRDEVSYEGQAAIEMEQLAAVGDARNAHELRFDLEERDGKLIIDPSPVLSGIVNGMLERLETADLAAGFHAALASVLAEACLRIRRLGGPGEVVLCGGVFQNRLLTRLAVAELERYGLNPIVPGEVPVNDGGLALGQAVAANAILDEEER